MRRSNLLVWGSIILSASTLFPIWYSQAASAAERPAASATAGVTTPLTTVPEDGSGADDIPSSSRLVRDIVSARPNEDMIICIAGCRPGADRVVYAQPADPSAKKPEVAQTPPAHPAPAASAEAPVQPEAAQATDDKSKDATAEMPAEPAAAQSASEGKGHMEPTAAQPEGASGDAPAAQEKSSESSDDQPSEQPPESSSDEPQHPE